MGKSDFCLYLEINLRSLSQPTLDLSPGAFAPILLRAEQKQEVVVAGCLSGALWVRHDQNKQDM